MIVCEQAEGYVRLTLDEYQYIELIEDREVILPNPDSFTEIQVYVDAKQSETLTFREVTWIDQLDLTLGTMSVIYLSYINGKWYGRTNSYEDSSDVTVPPGTNPDTPDTPDTPGTNPDEPTIVTYSVSNTLSNAENNNKITSINKNSRYQAIITAKDNYAMDSISVLMNGVNVTNQYVTPIYEGEEIPGGGTPTTPGTPPGGSSPGELVAPEGAFRITAINPVDIDDNYATGEIVFNRGVGITNLNVPKGQTFDLLYCTSAPAVKHEISWDGGRTYQDKTSSITTVGESSYKYIHEAVSVDSYNMVIRTTDANGNIDSKLFSIIFN